VEGAQPGTRQSGLAAPLAIPSMVEQMTPLVLVVDRKHYTGPFKFLVRVRDEQGRVNITREVQFMGPDPRLLREEEEEREHELKEKEGKHE